MALLTEEDVRRMSNQGTRGPVVVNRDQMLTPGARDYLPRPPPPNTALCSVPP